MDSYDKEVSCYQSLNIYELNSIIDIIFIEK